MIDELRSKTACRVLGPDDAGYDEARSLWNGDIDRRPAVIAQCNTADDVAAAIALRRERTTSRSRCAAAATTSPATACATTG